MKISAPNYTLVPNDLFDRWLPFLNGPELMVLLGVVRKTFGTPSDEIGINELVRVTQMNEEAVLNAVKSLREKGAIDLRVFGYVCVLGGGVK